MSTEPFLVPLASAWTRVLMLLVIGVWLGGLTSLVIWWVQPQHWPSVAGCALYSSVVGFELVGQALWVLLALRARRPNPVHALPELRAAMVVTKAPSEPWSMVRTTLEAMLTQDLPLDYDVWLADEDPEPAVLDWCLRHGVRVSTRRGIAEYHQHQWPRRTRCKEGNLAYFYDTYGYDGYDVVSQLDADHVPERDYLRRVLAPFIDPRVGYVAAPSICDSNAVGSWSARGRLFLESVLHGPVQAGCSSEYAPSCIGSHYAVRTAALRSAGGLGPELAEDFSTTIMLNAAGWKGVFAIDAIAHGAGPECVADCVTQDFQWARSIVTIMLELTPRCWRRLTARAKLRLAWAQLWYPLSGLAALAWVVFPIWSLVTGEPLIHVSIGAFYLHVLTPALAVFASQLWFKRRGLLRPTNARPISWEAWLFVFVRWPWALMGTVQALVGFFARRQFDFKVTPKGGHSSRPLRTIVVVPYLALATASLLPVLLVRHAGSARGYYFWSLMNSAIYLSVTVAILLLHARENPGAATRPRLRALAGVNGLAAGTVLAALLGAAFLRGPEVLRAVPPDASLAEAAPIGINHYPAPIPRSAGTGRNSSPTPCRSSTPAHASRWGFQPLRWRPTGHTIRAMRSSHRSTSSSA